MIKDWLKVSGPQTEDALVEEKIVEQNSDLIWESQYCLIKL